MKLTTEEDLKLRLLSDDELYNEAVKFVAEHGVIKTNRMEGLDNIASAADGVTKVLQFVSNQVEKLQRKSEESEELGFYRGLLTKLNEFKANVEKKYEFIPQELLIEPANLGRAKKKQRNELLKKYTESYGLWVTREFIHHLSAENRYKSKE